MAYKYKIYTPEVWYSFFGGSASLLIKEDGLIYRGDAEYETFPKAIGKIDFDAGKVYGEDYLDYIKKPIGYIKYRGDVTEIYGENYYDLGARPILYIDNNRILSYDEYHRWVSGNPSGFIKEVGASGYSGSSASDANVYSSNSSSYQAGSNFSYSSEESKGKPGLFATLVGILLACIANIKYIIIALLVGAVFVFVPYSIFRDAIQNGDIFANVAIMYAGIGLIIGTISACVTSRNFEEAFYQTIGYTILVFVVGLLWTDIEAGNFSWEFSYLLLVIGGGIFIGFLGCALPALVCSALVSLFKGHFKKSKK